MTNNTVTSNIFTLISIVIFFIIAIYQSVKLYNRKKYKKYKKNTRLIIGLIGSILLIVGFTINIIISNSTVNSTVNSNIIIVISIIIFFLFAIYQGVKLYNRKKYKKSKNTRLIIGLIASILLIVGFTIDIIIRNT